MSEVDPLDLVETIREGLLVLDPDLTVRFVNRSFGDTFAVTPEDTVGRKLYELGNGQWDIPELRSLIETILPERETIEAFEVNRVFPSIGRRVMLLNARKVYRAGSHTNQVLVAIQDVTEQRRLRTRARGCARAYRGAAARARPPYQKQPADYCFHGQPGSAEPQERRGQGGA